MRPFVAHLRWVTWRTLRGPMWAWVLLVLFAAWMGIGETGPEWDARFASLRLLVPLAVAMEAFRAAQFPLDPSKTTVVFPALPLSRFGRAAAEALAILGIWGTVAAAVVFGQYLVTGYAHILDVLLLATTCATVLLTLWFRHPAAVWVPPSAAIALSNDTEVWSALAVMAPLPLGLFCLRWLWERRQGKGPRSRAFRRGSWLEARERGVEVVAVLVVSALLMGALAELAPWMDPTLSLEDARSMGRIAIGGLLGWGMFLLPFIARSVVPRGATDPARAATRAWDRMPVRRDALMLQTVGLSLVASFVPLAAIAGISLFVLGFAGRLHPEDPDTFLALFRAFATVWPVAAALVVFLRWSRVPWWPYVRPALGVAVALPLMWVLVVAPLAPWWLVVSGWLASGALVGLLIRGERARVGAVQGPGGAG